MVAAVTLIALAGRVALRARRAIDDRPPARLPPGAVVAHSTGDLPGLVHAAGVSLAPGGPVILAALATGVDEREAAEAISALGALAYRAAR